MSTTLTCVVPRPRSRGVAIDSAEAGFGGGRSRPGLRRQGSTLEGSRLGGRDLRNRDLGNRGGLNRDLRNRAHSSRDRRNRDGRNNVERIETEGWSGGFDRRVWQAGLECEG